MKLISPLPHKRGRIEIIPLIDIMFFLLAAFMVVSINRIKVDSLKIALPTNVPSLTHEVKEDFVSISLDTAGQVQVDKVLMTSKEMFFDKLHDMYARNPEQKILISADREAHHGDVMTVLGKIRQAGFQKVAFSLERGGPGSPASAGAETGSAAPSPAEAPAAAPAAPAVPASAPAAPAPSPVTAPAPAAAAPSTPPSPAPATH